ncbi:Barstar (barnase inhibitor) [Polystyrenella longa]|uniref:Barstar (Barnase inhibitor) n=1 Tax=Polystyrenella longa TaxID=2528007 RepID=A0A518CQW5_9PLAN|nr:barstar family protein [Polystyrenella longa]QDU81619.1 Barstar (barnase inhibitor) [Polystyrenella longa]
MAFLDHLAEVLEFPSYFGRNWDALSDCLTDLSWLKCDEITLDHVVMPALPTKELEIYFDILRDLVAYQGSERELKVHLTFAEGIAFPADLRDS